MLHLLSAAINPTISLEHALQRWQHVPSHLAEPPRRRLLPREPPSDLALS